MERWIRKTILIALCFGIFNTGCTHTPALNLEEAKAPKSILSVREVTCGQLQKNIKSQIKSANANEALQQTVINISKSQHDPITFADRTVSRAQYAEFSIQLLNAIMNDTGDEFISKNAVCINVHTVKSEGSKPNLLVTGYFTPVINASHHRSDRFSSPIYAKPDSLLTFDPAQFGFPQGSKTLRVRVNDGKVLPYYSRAEIAEASEPLAHIIGWTDPIDLFHSQVQGSMVIQFENGKKQSLEFADKNGHGYVALGNELPIDPPLSWQKIEEYLRELPKDELIDVLNINPSYVFFKPSQIIARTASSDPAMPEITIAADKTIYPFGLFGLLHTNENDQNNLVIVHDTGGAIQGAERIDWYLGVGDSAGELAGKMRDEGTFVALLPKTSH